LIWIFNISTQAEDELAPPNIGSRNIKCNWETTAQSPPRKIGYIIRGRSKGCVTLDAREAPRTPGPQHRPVRRVGLLSHSEAPALSARSGHTVIAVTQAFSIIIHTHLYRHLFYIHWSEFLWPRHLNFQQALQAFKRILLPRAHAATAATAYPRQTTNIHDPPENRQCV
jgi:hypothetical protein